MGTKRFRARRHDVHVENIEARCLDCDWGIDLADDTADRGRALTRAHVEATGHDVDFEITMGEMYSPVDDEATPDGRVGPP